MFAFTDKELTDFPWRQEVRHAMAVKAVESFRTDVRMFVRSLGYLEACSQLWDGLSQGDREIMMEDFWNKVSDEVTEAEATVMEGYLGAAEGVTQFFVVMVRERLSLATALDRVSEDVREYVLQGIRAGVDEAEKLQQQLMQRTGASSGEGPTRH